MKHTVFLRKPPKLVPTDRTPDGAICGNGDIGIVLGGDKKSLKMYISKSDFWFAQEGNNNGGIRVIGRLDINFGFTCEQQGYLVEQRMDEGELVGSFRHEDTFVSLRIVPCAVSNVILLEVEYNADEPEIVLNVKEGSGSITNRGNVNGVKFIERRMVSCNTVFETAAAVALKKVSEIENGGVHCERYIISVITNHDTANYRKNALDSVRAIEDFEFDSLLLRHADWWRNFYNKSSVKISDDELEWSWYFAQYSMAICARNPRFAPGLYGNFITSDSPGWGGDLHLNYNYQASFYALCSSNHTELTDCYLSCFEDFYAQGKRNAREYLGCRGIYLPVGIGPLGLNTSKLADSKEHGELFLGQKSNAAYSAVIVSMRWFSERDTNYALNHAYPFLRYVGDFWEDYLKKEDGRYVIYDDAIAEMRYYRGKDFVPEEDEYYNSFNPIISLGLVRMVFRTLLDMAKAIDADADKYEKWSDILENISAFPTFKVKGKEVFRLTEKGIDKRSENTLEIQHIFPAGEVGKESGERMLEIARNTVLIRPKWTDDNGCNSYYPAAVRSGVEPAYIIEKLKRYFKKNQLPNMLLLHYGGCLENCSTAASTLNEMMLQSYEGIVRIFPAWDSAFDCEYRDLLAYGAFLVSGTFSEGRFIKAEIKSQKGGLLKLEKPTDSAVVTLNSQSIISDEKIICVETKPGDVIHVSSESVDNNGGFINDSNPE